MIWMAALFLFQLPQLLEPDVDKNPYTSQADLDQGRKLYGGRCAGCHGPAGDGGKGANLAVSILPRATDDRALYRVIRYGLIDTEMPSSLMAPRAKAGDLRESQRLLLRSGPDHRRVYSRKSLREADMGEGPR